MKLRTKEEFDKLLGKLENTPNDLDLINKVAIGYFENPEKYTNHQDYEYFKKAYELN